MKAEPANCSTRFRLAVALGSGLVIVVAVIMATSILPWRFSPAGSVADPYKQQEGTEDVDFSFIKEPLVAAGRIQESNSLSSATEDDPFQVREEVRATADGPILEVWFPIRNVEFPGHIDVDVSSVATVPVVAEGGGETDEEALADALREAVHQVVGQLVDAGSFVKYGQVIEDRVLACAKSLVSDYEKLRERGQGGICRIRIRASTDRQQVVAKLREAGVPVASPGD